MDEKGRKFSPTLTTNHITALAQFRSRTRGEINNVSYIICLCPLVNVKVMVLQLKFGVVTYSLVLELGQFAERSDNITSLSIAL